MQLEKIAVDLRRRSPWEALDLGRIMVRAWAGDTYRIWFATYWLAGLLLTLALWPWPEFAMLILWWFKPLFDRILLHTYSRSLFGTGTTVKEAWRAIPGLIKAPGFLSGLTLRRLSLVRPFLLPVWLLEGQRGKAATARFRVLSQGRRGYGVWLTFICVHLSAILAWSLLLLLMFLLPKGLDDLFSWDELFFGGTTSWEYRILILVCMLADTIVEPLYVASGFSLYLNRRSELEGWDMELAFRRLAARKAALSPVLGVFVAGLFVMGMVASLLPQPVQAASGDVPVVTREHVRKTIDEILAAPVFGYEEETTEWQEISKPEEEEEEELSSDSNKWFEAYRRAIEFLGQVSNVLIWVGALVLAVLLLYLVMRYWDTRLLTGKKNKMPTPDFLFGLDVRPGSLPDDIAAAARQAIAAGQMLEALSILYRGALVALIHRFQIEFRDGDTEKDCLHRTRTYLDEETHRHFNMLLETWRMTAYAGHHPTPAEVEALCQDWVQFFEVQKAGT